MRYTFLIVDEGETKVLDGGFYSDVSRYQEWFTGWHLDTERISGACWVDSLEMAEKVKKVWSNYEQMAQCRIVDEDEINGMIVAKALAR